jgi:hypothetical protein
MDRSQAFHLADLDQPFVRHARIAKKKTLQGGKGLQQRNVLVCERSIVEENGEDRAIRDLFVTKDPSTDSLDFRDSRGIFPSLAADLDTGLEK